MPSSGYIHQIQYQGVSEPVFFVPEVVTMDKWFVQHFNQAVRHKQRPYLYLSYSIDQSPYFVYARGFALGVGKDTNTGIGARKPAIIGKKKDTNTSIGVRTV